MALFKVPERTGKATDTAVAKKANSTTKQAPIKGGDGIVGRINKARAIVERNLGKYRDEYLIINEIDHLHNYISACIENNVVAIDTETTGLDPILDSIVGFSLYTPTQKAAYIPINHKSYITGMKCDNQLDVKDIKVELDRLANANTPIIMFNACFDIRVIKNHIGTRLHCTWDCYLAARLLNENEGIGNNNLKKLHSKYCTDGDEESRFGDIFEGMSFDIVPINLGYLYAAHDAIITYELYEFQKPFLTPTDEKCINQGLIDVAWVFENIEMPCVDAVVEMEEVGIKFDFEYNKVLKDEYHKKLEEQSNEVYKIINMYSHDIDVYRLKNPGAKLDDPINIGSPTQLAILLYDIIGEDLFYDKKAKKESRSTSEVALTQINSPLCQAILKYRSLSVLVSTFIDKLPECVNPKDGRIHCKFNQYGADTGRMSSNDPNLQNIPSHNKDIRKMFVASDGYVLMSSDFSQQEPKCLAALCRRDGDSQMYDTFMAGRDLYVEIASKAFNKPYEDCCEFRPDGTKNPEGKERRSQAKTILLGVNYGRGVDSIAEQLGTTKQKAQEIKDSVFRGFPAIKKFEEDSINMAKTKGFVTTVCGRKRRLPSMMLPDYEVKWKDGVAPDDDPLGFDNDAPLSTEVPENIQKKWLAKVRNAPFMKRRQVFEAANEEGLWIVDNTRDKDTTKVVNARIQGSAADLTKRAMIELYQNQHLRDLGFRMLIPVHDEIIAECPEENAKECAELLAKTMSHAAEEILEMPIKCDVEVTKAWYGESIEL